MKNYQKPSLMTNENLYAEVVNACSAYPENNNCGWNPCSSWGGWSGWGAWGNWCKPGKKDGKKKGCF